MVPERVYRVSGPATGASALEERGHRGMRGAVPDVRVRRILAEDRVGDLRVLARLAHGLRPRLEDGIGNAARRLVDEAADRRVDRALEEHLKTRGVQRDERLLAARGRAHEPD